MNRNVNKLNPKDKFLLTQFVIAEYAKSGMPDSQGTSPASNPKRMDGLESRVKILEDQMETLLRERLAHARSPHPPNAKT